MRHKIISFILMVVALATAGATKATPVDANRAAAVASHFWATQGAKGILAERHTEFAHLHLFTGSEGGFVVVSADDCARPVLAWSADAPTGDTLHAAMRYWLGCYERQIAYAAAHGMPSSDEWRQLFTSSDSLSTVGPLLSTTWDQGDYYNDSTPINYYDQNQHCYTGCVATSTAQVMKYWNWPVTGRGSHSYYMYGEQSANFGATTYAWSQMPDALTAVSSAAQVAAVAQLMYHIGVAVEMQYGTDASGARDVSYGENHPSAEHALKQHFGYSNNIHSLSRAAYSQQEWLTIIQQEIDSLRPVIYSGFGVANGHSFVCDGYDSHQRLHINWGWGGYSDGYFACDALDPQGSGIGGNSDDSYNMRQGIIVGIEPDTAAYDPAAQYTVGLTATEGGTASGAGTYAAGTVVTLTATASGAYRFDSWSDGVRWNPRSLPLCGDMNLAATFVRVDATDTLQLDNGAFIGSYYINNSSLGSTTLPISRSVSFADSMMTGRGQLTAVMYYTIDTGMHTIAFSHGDNQHYEKTARAMFPGFWNTVYVDDTILLDTLHGISVEVTWPQKAPGMASGAWPIRVITDGIFSPHQLTVVGGTGSGLYTTDTTVVITATPVDSSSVFISWSDGNTDNPRTVQLVSDSIFTAIFSSPQMFYLRVEANDTTLGHVSDVSGWYSRNDYQTLWHLGETVDGSTYITAYPNANARVLGWDAPDENVSTTQRPDLIWLNAFSTMPDTLALTATFAPVHVDDTLRYDDGEPLSYLELYDTTTYFRWGVKYDPSALDSVTHIYMVQAYLPTAWVGATSSVQPCTYTVSIYQGGEESPATLLQSQNHTVNLYESPHRTIEFSTPVPVDNTQPVWVVVSCTLSPSTMEYRSPMVATMYCGNPNSNYVWTPQHGWTHYGMAYDDGWHFEPDAEWTYASWFIRAITSAPPLPEYTVSVVSANTAMGSVSGGGTYTQGTQITISATPNDGYRFTRWNDNNTTNPRTVTVTQNRTYTAYFEPIDNSGIDDVDRAGVRIYSQPLLVVVEGAEGLEVEVFDISGRLVHSCVAGSPLQAFAVPQPGAYTVRVGDRPATKVVVVR